MGFLIGYAMDLRTSFPRSMRVTLAGHVHLARMVDKCRAVLAGMEGEYIYPCPMDIRLLEFAGLTDMEFTAAVKAHLTDEGIAQWFEKNSKRHPPAELREWNEMMVPADRVQLKSGNTLTPSAPP